MHKEQLVKYLAKTNRRPKHHYQEALTEIFDGIKRQLAEGKPVQLIGFGTFYTRMKKAGKGMNFKTKQKIEYKAVRLAQFKPGNVLKRAVRGRAKPAAKKAKKK